MKAHLTLALSSVLLGLPLVAVAQDDPYTGRPGVTRPDASGEIRRDAEVEEGETSLWDGAQDPSMQQPRGRAMEESGAYADKEDQIEELNELLRGEISAVQTYRQALEKLANEPGAEKLRANLADHEAATKAISAEVARLGGKPSTDSGAWGAWAQTVTGAAKLLGDVTALKALKEGEEHGVKEYEEILSDSEVNEAFKVTVRTVLLPKQRAHIAAIDELMERVENQNDAEREG